MNQRIGGPRSSPAVRNLSVWGLGSPSVFPYVFFALFLLLVGDSWQRAEVDVRTCGRLSVVCIRLSYRGNFLSF